MLVDPALRTPYVDDWSLDLQRSITSNLSIEIGYVGNHGTKLVSALDINQPIATTALVPGVGTDYVRAGLHGRPHPRLYISPSQLSRLTLVNCRANTALEQTGRPYNGQYPYFKFIDDYGNLDSSNYNGLQLPTALNYHGLTLTGGYAFSHALSVNACEGTAGTISFRSIATEISTASSIRRAPSTSA